MTDYYADLIGNINVTGAMVRIDFLSRTTTPHQQQDTPQQEVLFQTSHRLVLPLDGFLRSLGVQEQVRTKLIADGVIKIDEKAPAAPIKKPRKPRS